MARRKTKNNKSASLLFVLVLLISYLIYYVPKNSTSIEDINFNNINITNNNNTDNEEENTKSENELLSEIEYDNTTDTNTTKVNDLVPIKVHYIDVGQGDSIFIELPNNETMLIDAGDSSAKKTIIDTIKGYGIDTINYFVLTHPHADHIGSAASIVESFNIKSIYMPKVASNTKTFENLLNAINKKGLKIKEAKKGVNILDIDNLKIEILSPTKDKYTDLNNYSAVIKLTYKDTKFLFTGDAEAEVESELTDIDIDVLKVGHHGSDSSTTTDFLNKTTPSISIISVGKGNKYDHPKETTLNKLNKIGSKVYRTDELGTITVESNGKTIKVL